MKWNSKIAIITGGGQGIGKATAVRLLRDGWAVILAEIDEEAGREAEESFKPLGPVRFIRADVAIEEQVEGMVRETIDTFGGIDLLVNNAAISKGKPIAELRLDEWNRVLAVNLTGPFLCAKHASPHLASRQGAIVNIASTRALMSEADTEAYSASKGGLLSLTHSLALSLGPRVRVNCICPGWIETGDWKKKSRRREAVHSLADESQHPVGRVGRPGDIANLVLYLASESAGFITGAHFVVDGGMTRKMIYAE